MVKKSSFSGKKPVFYGLQPECRKPNQMVARETLSLD